GQGRGGPASGWERSPQGRGLAGSRGHINFKCLTVDGRRAGKGSRLDGVEQPAPTPPAVRVRSDRIEPARRVVLRSHEDGRAHGGEKRNVPQAGRPPPEDHPGQSRWQTYAGVRGKTAAG